MKIELDIPDGLYETVVEYAEAQPDTETVGDLIVRILEREFNIGGEPLPQGE